MDRVVIGREHELREVRGILDEAALRSCGLLLVGEAGIGKTTLWAAAVDDAVRRGYTVLVSRPAEAESELAFAALTDLLATVDEAVLGVLPAVQRAALEEALRRRASTGTVDPTAVGLGTLAALRALAAATPVIVALDDLQWLDAPSLRALTFAYRRLDGSPAGLVGTVRTGFEAELTQLAARDKDALRRIVVEGLGERELSELVFARTGRTLTPGRLRRLARLSGGNPYYALELARAGGEQVVPESLGVALRARMSGLSQAARSSALEAALLGRFDETFVSRPELAELRAAGVVETHAGELRFSHPLLASTLVELHTVEERQAVHLSLAAALDDPDERALHLARGTRSAGERVAAELERAAERLDARGAPEPAALLAERAAALTPPGDDRATTRRLIRASDLYQAAGEGREHVLPLLERLATTLAHGPDRARVLVRLGWLGAQLDTMPMSDSVVYQERALAETGAEAAVVTAAHAVLARLLGIGGDYRAALHHAEHAVALGAGIEPDRMFPSPAGELGIARFFAGQGLDEQLFDDAIAREESGGRGGEPYQSPRLQLALALLHTAQLTRARDLFADLLERSVELGRIRSTTGCVLHLTELEVRAGNLDRAEAYAREFVHLDRQLRGELSGEWYPSAIVAVHLGRVDDARRILTAGIEESRAIESTIWLAHQLEALGHLELALGNLAAARTALVPVVPLLRATGLGEWSVHPVHPDAIETLVGLGELDEAAELQAELAEFGRRLDRPWAIAAAARSAALVAASRGAVEEGLDAAERALVEHGRLDWPLEHGRTLLVTGELLRRLGRRRDAAGRLAEARVIFGALRNPLWLARVDAEERRLGGRRRANGALTPTEARVAALAGQGLRNAEIAAQLFVSPKTIEATLSRVYRKVGVRSRTELARHLSESTGR